MQEATFTRTCQDQHAGRPAPSLGWPGERKSIGATSRGKRRFWQKQISRCNKSRLGLPGTWGPGTWAGASRGLGPGRPGAWGPGHQSCLLNQLSTPPPPPPPQAEKGEKKRVFTLSVTETIQHAPQGRRMFYIYIYTHYFICIRDPTPETRLLSL